MLKKLLALTLIGFATFASGTGDEYYNHTTFPATGSAATSASMRAEFDLIEAGFNKLPTLSGNGSKLVGINSGATALEAVTSVSVTQGGTGGAPASGDQVLVSDSTSAATWKSIADCTDTGGNHLNYTASTNSFSCGTTTSASAPLLSTLGAAGAANSINNADYAQTWNWALTTASKSAFTFTENTAATGGSGAQYLLDVKTIAASTAEPFRVRTRAGADNLIVTRTGDVTLTGTSGTVGSGTTGSAITLTSGQGAATSAGGAISITTGAGGATSGASGALTIATGTETSGTTGAISILSGAGASDNTGSVTIGSGAGSGATTGAVTLSSGNSTAGDSGNLTIQVGTATSAGNGGDLLIRTQASGGAGGTLTLSTGNTGNTGGGIVITAGGITSTTTGQTVAITSGAGSGVASGNGGALTVTGGAGSTTTTGGTGGTVTIKSGAGGLALAGGAATYGAGNGGATGAGGATTLSSGNGGATSGVAGAIAITVGSATSGNGSAITLTAGNGAGGTNSGGDINLVPGAAVSTGVPGEIKINSAVGMFDACWQQFLGASVPVSGASYPLFLANRAYRVKAVSVYQSSAVTPTVDIRKDTGTNAPGGGSTVLTGAISFGAANTVVTGTVSSTISAVNLAAGDRLSATWGGTVGALTGGMVCVSLVPI